MGKNNVSIMSVTLAPSVWKFSVLESKCDTEKLFNDNPERAYHEKGQISIVAPHEKGPKIESLVAWDTNGTAVFNHEQIPDPGVADVNWVAVGAPITAASGLTVIVLAAFPEINFIRAIVTVAGDGYLTTGEG